MIATVGMSKSLLRVLQVPKRHYSADQTADIVQRTTRALRTPGGAMTLLPHQAIALWEMKHNGLMFGGGLDVGSGKTLITALLPRASSAKRPLLLVPGDLRDKTANDYAQLAQHFQFDPPRIMSYEYLSRAHSEADLNSYAPDLIMADESHRLKNTQAGCTRKLARYLTNMRGTRFAPLSGTIQGRRLDQFAHVAYWALRTYSPLPIPNDGEDWKDTLTFWGEALDGVAGDYRHPGELLRLEDPEDDHSGNPTTRARRAFAKRLLLTPGSIRAVELNVPAKINIKVKKIETPPAMQSAWKDLCRWELPNGQELIDAIEVWTHAQELACGFYYKWRHPGPDIWMKRRKAWAAVVRQILQNSHTLDTPAQVAEKAGREGWQIYQDWIEIEPTFTPQTVPVWISDHMLDLIARWKHRGGIVWVPNRALGARMGEIGLDYYADRGQNAAGALIDNCTDHCVAASDSSCSTGHNLQQWNNMLVLGPRSSAEWWEQLIGREHRLGQEAESVNVFITSSCTEHENALRRSLQFAAYSQEILLQKQKLLIANRQGYDAPTPHGYAWAFREKQKE